TKSQTKAPSKLAQKQSELRRILTLIKTVDQNLDTSKMPGLKSDFKELCQRLHPMMFSVAQSTFDDYLDGVCTFRAGARETDYYLKLEADLPHQD
ncbi:MAG: hypothetical protein WCD45_09990, partial [Gallionella sp.]